ncbi:hypothetical protein DXG01_011010 [Tephrocybe rancida]|nr:hypothetical protein DXG01_011010 [Tephrocybe rancida]
MNTNKKIGELELTFTRKSIRAANLRAMLSDDEDLRRCVANTIQTIEMTEREDVRSFRLASLLDPTAHDNILDVSAKPVELHGLLLDEIHTTILSLIGRNNHILDQVSFRSVSYGTASSSASRNSNILFCPMIHESDNTPVAATILEIFQHTYEMAVDGSKSPEFYLVVQGLTPIDSTADPYKELGFAGGFLCSPTFTTPPRLIHLSQVISHFARTDFIDGEYAGLIHVLPIDRVSSYN